MERGIFLRFGESESAVICAQTGPMLVIAKFAQRVHMLGDPAYFAQLRTTMRRFEEQGLLTCDADAAALVAAEFARILFTEDFTNHFAVHTDNNGPSFTPGQMADAARMQRRESARATQLTLTELSLSDG